MYNSVMSQKQPEAKQFALLDPWKLRDMQAESVDRRLREIYPDSIFVATSRTPRSPYYPS